MSSLELKLEVFAGSSVSDAAKDLCALAGKLGVTCTARFNDVLLMARPGDSSERMVTKYHAAIAVDNSHRIATG